MPHASSRYYNRSRPPRPQHPISLADLMQGRSGNGNSGPAARPAQVSLSLPTLPQQPAITFVNGYGHRFPIDGGTAWGIVGHHPYAPSNGKSPATEAGQDDFEGHSSLATLIKEEERRLKRIFFNPFIREESGHHFGGYHPGKNVRQIPSVRYLTTASEASSLLGVPVSEIVSAGMSLAMVEEQRNYGAWANALTGNGHSK